MAQVKNEEEKKKENVKKVSKKTTETKKTTTKKTTSRTSDNEATKKQTTAKKTTTAAKKTATGKKTKSEALKNEELNNINKELKNASNLENIKVKKTGTKTAGAKVSGEKLSEKTTRNSKTKTAKSPKTNKSKGKVTKVSGSKKMGEVVEEGDAVITEKMQLMEKEVGKDLKSKSKLPKTEEKKLSSVVFENLCVAIAIMVYLVFMILGFMNIKEEVYNVDLKVFSFIILVIAILLFERAYKKDSGKLCAFGIETLFLAIATMGLLYVNIEIQNIFLPIAASISMLFAIYYVAKSIYLYSKMKKKYFVDNMKDIIQKEEKE